MLFQKCMEAIVNGKTNSAFDHYKQHIQVEAEAYLEREKLAKDQVTDYVNSHPKEKNTVVLFGSSHTAIHHQYKKGNPDQNIKFERHDSSHNFPYFLDIITRKIIFNSKNPVQNHQYKIAFIRDILFGMIDIGQEVVPLDLKQDKQISKISEQEADNIIIDFQKQYQQLFSQSDNPEHTQTQISLYLDTAKYIRTKHLSMIQLNSQE